MNRLDLDELVSVREYPCVTITLPRHRAAPDDRQDPVRVKNLVKLAAIRLDADVPREDAQVVKARLEEVARGIDASHREDGLVLFASKSFARRFDLPFAVPERIVIDDTFLTRDVVRALAGAVRYWTLVLGDEPARLWHGFRDRLVEVTTGGFPLVYGGPGELAENALGEVEKPRGRHRARSRPGGHTGTPNFGFEPSTTREEYRRHFLRSVDDALGLALARDPLPVVLAGVERQVAFFRTVSRHGDRVIATVPGSHGKTSGHELGALVWPRVVAQLEAERLMRASRELDGAIKASRLASGIVACSRAAHEKRGALLLVEEGYAYPGRVDPTGPLFDDAVDDLLEAVLRNGGDALLLPDGTLRDHEGVALTLRYAIGAAAA